MLRPVILAAAAAALAVWPAAAQTADPAQDIATASGQPADAMTEPAAGAPAMEAAPLAEPVAALPPEPAEPAIPDGITQARDGALLADLRAKLTTDVVMLTLESRNAKAGGISQADIDALDKQWRAERKTDDQPLITAVLASPLSAYLLHIQAGSLGLFSEIFVMDSNGLNAGQSAITSDYWQGDEAKFQKTFDVGPDAIFIDEPEFHDGSGTWRQQVNMTIARDGRPVGAATIEVNLTELQRRRDAGLI